MRMLGLARTPLIPAVVLLLVAAPGLAMARDSAPSYPAFAWRFETGSQITTPPFAVGPVVYVDSEDGYLRSLATDTGAERWRYPSGTGYFVQANFTVTDGMIVLANTKGDLDAVDAETGRRLWRRSIHPSEQNEIFSAPTVVDGLVYVDDIEGDAGIVYALDARTGEDRWQARTGPMQAYPLTVDDGTLYVGDVTGSLIAFDSRTGDLRWQYRSGLPLHSRPLVRDGKVYVASEGGLVEAVGTETGEQQWSSRLGTEESPIPWIQAITDDLLYVSVGTTLMAVDVATGTTRWDVPTAGTGPLIDGDAVYVTDDEGRLTALDARSGKRRWRSVATNSVATIADGVLYVAGGSRVYAIDAATGNDLWQVRTGGMVRAEPAVSGDRIYVASTDHFVYALRMRAEITPRGGEEPSTVIDQTSAESLIWTKLEPLPPAPVYVGLWRLTAAAGSRITVPRFPGPAAAYVAAGTVHAPEPLSLVMGPFAGIEGDEVESGGGFLLPLDAPLKIDSAGKEALELLVVAVVPPDAQPKTDKQSGLQMKRLGGGMEALTPGDGAFVGLTRWTAEPGTALLPELSAWPEVVAVQEGTLNVAIASGDPVSQRSPSGSGSGLAHRGIGPGESALVPAGGLRFAWVDGSVPVEMFVVEVDGDIEIGQGAGCGGRCLSSR
jgi:outer membrane protein assembly factor BamB